MRRVLVDDILVVRSTVIERSVTSTFSGNM